MALKYANNAKTTLNGAITDSATSIVVVDGSVFPTLGGGDYFYMTLEDVSLNREIVKVTARSTNTLTVVRAQNGTTARAFSNADKAEGRMVTGILDDLAALVGGVTPSAFFLTLVDDTTAGAALTTLGISAAAQTWLATPSSANLRSLISDESGTGALLFAGGALGAATATSINGLTITTTTGTLTLTNGKTFSVSNTLTLAGTDGSTLNIGAGGTLGSAAFKATGTSGNNVALLDGANTWSAAQNETFASTGFTKTLTNTDAGSLGVGIKMVHDSASPAANDVPGYINIYGKDSAGNEELYGYFQTCIVSPTNGAETSFSQMGSKANSIRIGSGLYFSQGSATSDMGLSTVNAAGYYINGTSLFATANTWSGANKFTSDVGPQFNSPFLGFWNAAGTRKAYIQAVAAGTLTIQPESDTVGVRINVNGGAATVEGDTIATLTASQSLSNKTLSSPTISGTVAGAYTRSNTTTYSQGYGVNFANSGATHGLFDYNNTTLIMTYNTGDWKTSVRLLSTSMQLYANNGLASWDGTSFFMGDGSAIAAGKINGSGSGTNGGAFLGIYNNSTTVIALGNYSAIIGGSYDATMLFYVASSAIKFRVGGSTEWLAVNSSGQATFIHNIKWGSSAQGTLTFSGSDAYIDAAGDMNLRAGGGTTFAIGRTTGLQAKTAAGTTTTGTLVVADANTRVTLTGGITVPNSVFAAGDMHVWHAGTSARTITRGSGVTMYVNGTNVASATLAANSIGGAYWSDASTVHLTGAIS